MRLMDTDKRLQRPLWVLFYYSAKHVSSQVLQPKLVNKRYRRCHTFISVHRHQSYLFMGRRWSWDEPYLNNRDFNPMIRGREFYMQRVVLWRALWCHQQSFLFKMLCRQFTTMKFCPIAWQVSKGIQNVAECLTNLKRMAKDYYNFTKVA